MAVLGPQSFSSSAEKEIHVKSLVWGSDLRWVDKWSAITTAIRVVIADDKMDLRVELSGKNWKVKLQKPTGDTLIGRLSQFSVPAFFIWDSSPTAGLRTLFVVKKKHWVFGEGRHIEAFQVTKHCLDGKYFLFIINDSRSMYDYWGEEFRVWQRHACILNMHACAYWIISYVEIWSLVDGIVSLTSMLLKGTFVMFFIRFVVTFAFTSQMSASITVQEFSTHHKQGLLNFVADYGY